MDVFGRFDFLVRFRSPSKSFLLSTSVPHVISLEVGISSISPERGSGVALQGPIICVLRDPPFKCYNLLLTRFNE